MSRIPPSVAFLVAQLGYDVGQQLGDALGALGLEHRHFGLLRLLAESGGASQRELGQLLRITPNRMVALVDDLEQKGLVERRPHPVDRRAYAVTLTAAGTEALGQAFQAAFGVEADLCAPLEKDERERLLSLLTKLAVARNEKTGALPGVHPGLMGRGNPATRS